MKRYAMETDLNCQLREIAEGTRACPETTARRHHFVPAFSLARFAEPAGERKGRLFQLDVASGKPQRTSPDDAAFEIDLYTYGFGEERVNRMEAFLSIVEIHSARALARLRDDPAGLTPQDRATISYFLVLQESRTPAGLARSQRLQRASMEMINAVDLATAAGFRAEYQRRIGDDKTDDEIEAVRLTMKAQLEEGRVDYQHPKGMSIKLILGGAHEIAELVYGLDWVLLQAEDAEFVTSDRPISMADPSPRHSWTGNGWISSPNAINFYPLSPHQGLLIHQGDECGWSVATSGPKQVRRLNLQTYGWAERRIFGRTQQVVTEVRAQAKRYPNEVVRPRPAKYVMLEPAAPGDPEGFVFRDAHGQDRFVRPTVVDPDGPPGAAAQVSAQVAERVKPAP